MERNRSICVISFIFLFILSMNTKLYDYEGIITNRYRYLLLSCFKWGENLWIRVWEKEGGKSSINKINTTRLIVENLKRRRRLRLDATMRYKAKFHTKNNRDVVSSLFSINVLTIYCVQYLTYLYISRSISSRLGIYIWKSDAFLSSVLNVIDIWYSYRTYVRLYFIPSS